MHARPLAFMSVLSGLTGCNQTAPLPSGDVAYVRASPPVTVVIPADKSAEKGVEATNVSTPIIAHASRRSTSSRQLCWQDYCPCDPVETTTDKWICRNLRGGIDVPADIMALGAMQRDSERSIRAWNRNNPEIDPISIPVLPDTE
jgi:hypothetical protein